MINTTLFNTSDILTESTLTTTQCKELIISKVAQTCVNTCYRDYHVMIAVIVAIIGTYLFMKFRKK